MNNGKKVIMAADATQMCQHCRGALVGTKQVIAQNIIVFNSCGHQYHQNCLAQLDNVDVCAKCERFVLQGKELMTDLNVQRRASQMARRIRTSIVRAHLKTKRKRAR